MGQGYKARIPPSAVIWICWLMGRGQYLGRGSYEQDAFKRSNYFFKAENSLETWDSIWLGVGTHPSSVCTLDNLGPRPLHTMYRHLSPNKAPSNQAPHLLHVLPAPNTGLSFFSLWQTSSVNNFYPNSYNCNWIERGPPTQPELAVGVCAVKQTVSTSKLSGGISYLLSYAYA